MWHVRCVLLWLLSLNLVISRFILRLDASELHSWHDWVMSSYNNVPCTVFLVLAGLHLAASPWDYCPEGSSNHRYYNYRWGFLQTKAEHHIKLVIANGTIVEVNSLTARMDNGQEDYWAHLHLYADLILFFLFFFPSFPSSPPSLLSFFLPPFYFFSVQLLTEP